VTESLLPAGQENIAPTAPSRRKEFPGLPVRATVTLRCDNARMTPDEQGLEHQFDLDEGWFTDPWGQHEARWISLGKATDLVRDGDAEAHDPPPDTQPTVTPTLIPPEAPGQVGAGDLRRADDAEAEVISPGELRERLVDAAEESVLGGIFVPRSPGR
jgi:hypothetical protein